MISWLCGRMSAGKRRRWRAGSRSQPELICGVSELVNQVSKTGGHGIDGQDSRLGDHRPRVVRAAVAVERVPDGDRRSEEALAADAPVHLQVLGPVAVAQPHEVRVPRDLVAFGEQRVLLVEQAHEPLPGRDELERPVALLVVLDRVLDGLGLAAERPGLAQQLDDRLARRDDRLPGDVVIAAARGCGVVALPARAAEGDRDEAAVAPEDLAERQLVLAPPLHVGRVAEGAHHEDAGALLGIDQRAREDRDGDVEERRHGALAEEVAVAGVGRMRRHADARGQQLGPRGGDDEALLAPLDAEGEAVERAVRRAVLDLGLRDRGLEVDVPHGGRLEAVDVALRVEVAEGELCQVPAARVDGRVLLAPVDREADPPPEGLEGLLVLARDAQTEVDEVPA